MSPKPRPKDAPGPRPAADYGQDPADAPTDATRKTTRVKADAGTKTTRQRQQPATETDAGTDDRPTERVSLLLTTEDARALKTARVDDGVDANKRLRAMIALWRDDQRHRARVDKRAKQYRR